MTAVYPSNHLTCHFFSSTAIIYQRTISKVPTDAEWRENGMKFTTFPQRLGVQTAEGAVSWSFVQYSNQPHEGLNNSMHQVQIAYQRPIVIYYVVHIRHPQQRWAENPNASLGTRFEDWESDKYLYLWIRWILTAVKYFQSSTMLRWRGLRIEYQRRSGDVVVRASLARKGSFGAMEKSLVGTVTWAPYITNRSLLTG
jgi:hypothetical protein